MAGHSKWKNIQVRKGAQDAKKGKMFTKVTKEIMLAAKAGGGDQMTNARLRSAVAAAKAPAWRGVGRRSFISGSGCAN